MWEVTDPIFSLRNCWQTHQGIASIISNGCKNLDDYICRRLRAAHSKQQTILRLTLASMLLLTYQSWQLKSLVQSSLSLSLHLVYNCVSIFCQGASYFNGERHDQLFFSSSCRRRRLCFCIFRCAQLLFLSLPVGVTCWPEAAGVTVCYHITSLCSKNIGVAAETSSIRAAIIVVTTCSWHDEPSHRHFTFTPAEKHQSVFEALSGLQPFGFDVFPPALCSSVFPHSSVKSHERQVTLFCLFVCASGFRREVGPVVLMFLLFLCRPCFRNDSWAAQLFINISSLRGIH